MTVRHRKPAIRRACAAAALAAIGAAVVCAAAGGADTIPTGSLQKLQGVYRTVCDELWEANDYYWHAGDFERCIAVLRLIAEMDPRDTGAFANAAWLMWNADRSDEAEVFLKKGLAQNSDVDDLYFELGFFYYRASRFAEAVNMLEAAAKLAPEVRTWHLLAHSQERAGNKDEALRIWRQMEATEKDPTVPRIQIERILKGEPPPAPESRH